MSNQPKVQMNAVCKTFPLTGRDFVALEDVSLTIADQEFVTVVGPSGCGKTTLLNVVAGLETPTSGEVKVDGKLVSGPSPERGVIFQQYALFPWLTVRENVEFGLKIAKRPKKEVKERAQHFIDLVGLTQFADALPKMLSGGMKQRCALARAYAVDPKLLLMDEPFGALDALTRVNLQGQLLKTWESEKRTVVFITHDVDEAVFLANRIVVMAVKPGRLKEIIDVKLPYPRHVDLRITPEFSELRNRVWSAVYSQELNEASYGEKVSEQTTQDNKKGK